MQFLSIILSFLLLTSSAHAYMPAACLSSTEGDPDGILGHCFNVIDGDYCEVATDITILAPDPLVLQRFYNTHHYITGQGSGRWRIFPQALMVIGQDPDTLECVVDHEICEKTCAFVGERSGGILTYSGWRQISDPTKEPLKIDYEYNGIGMVNTYAGEIAGRTDHRNNRLHYKRETCEITLGDGSKRVYELTNATSDTFPGSEIITTLADKLLQPHFFRLTSEILPSGNVMLFSYNQKGHLDTVEIRDASRQKIHAWMHFHYDFRQDGYIITISTSDEKSLEYGFEKKHDHYVLKSIKGSHCNPITYEYTEKNGQLLLTKKLLVEGRFLEIEYDEQLRAKQIYEPSASTSQPEVMRSFSYGNGFTEAFDALGLKTCYRYDTRKQLTAIERFDDKGNLYRVDRKHWGQSQHDYGLLLARSVSNGEGKTLSYRSFEYDNRGNVIVERLYGNLTGDQDACLKIDAHGKLLEDREYQTKTFAYSDNGFNLPTYQGDVEGSHTAYHYKTGTDRLIKKFLYDDKKIKKRYFYTYNSDGACTSFIEDDGSEEDVNDVYGWNVEERHITLIHPKEHLPGIGLPETVEYRACDYATHRDVLQKKLVHTYSAAGLILTSDVFDANEKHAFTIRKTYNHEGKITSEIDSLGNLHIYEYDGHGNLIRESVPNHDEVIERKFDFRNQLTYQTEGEKSETFSYDALGRKVSTTDSYGNSTYFEYDAFSRLTKVIHPTVLDEYEKPIRPTFCYAYDIFGHVTSITDPKGYVTNKSYSLRGDVAKIDYPDGSSELFKYDTAGNLCYHLTRELQIIRYKHDYQGRVLKEFVLDASGCNDLAVHNYQYNGFKVTYESEEQYGYGYGRLYKYDGAGRLIKRLNRQKNDTSENRPDSEKMEVSYDAFGREHCKKVWFGVDNQDYSLERTLYDISGNITEKRIEDSAEKVLYHRGYVYDSRGRCIKEYTTQDGRKLTCLNTVYDSAEGDLCCFDALGQETKTCISFDGSHVCKTIISPLGVQTVFKYDTLGRLTAIIKNNAAGILLSSKKLLYDALGNKCAEFNDVLVDGQKQVTQVSRWIYGPMSRLEEEIVAAGTPQEKHTFYQYDACGRLASKTLPGATSPITYSYNKASRVSKIEYLSDDKERNISNSFSYDNKGNLVYARTLQGAYVSRRYNSLGQLESETIGDSFRFYSTRFQYDRKSRITKITLPDDSSIVYTYDALFGKQVQRLSSQGKPLYTHSYNSYNMAGHVIEESLIGLAGKKTTTFDSCGRKTSIQTDYCIERVPESGYNPLGHILEIDREKDCHTQHFSYAYNSLSQLTAESGKCSKIYAHDSLDNCVKVGEEERLYNYLNQLIYSSSTKYHCDEYGYLQSKICDGQETSFKSDILAQLVAVDVNDQSIHFAYDAFGRRIAKWQEDSKGAIDQQSMSRYFYCGYHELGALDPFGKTIQELRVPGLAGDQIAMKSIAFEIDKKPYAVMHDIFGNVVALVDPDTREVVESYSYSAFGETGIYDSSQEPISKSNIGNAWRYAEKRIDEETNLIYFGLRYYDPSTQRWISPDPAGTIDGPNLYAYLHNNPLNAFDRFGLATETDGLLANRGGYAIVPDPDFVAKDSANTQSKCEAVKGRRSTLPSISYCEDFENLRNDYRRSGTFDLSDQGYSELLNLRIGFINGINNTYEDAHASAMYIAQLAGGYNIHAVYNATHGTVSNLRECYMGLCYIATEPVHQLHNMWNSFFEESSADAKYLMFCHSQGAIHVRNALLDYPPELRERISVAAIAPAAYIYEETCASVYHYRNDSWWRDFVPYSFDRAGAYRVAHTIVNVTSHPDAPLFDHTFLSPTYQRSIRTRIDRFLKTAR